MAMTKTIPGDATAEAPGGRQRSALLGMGLLAALTANLLHNDFGIDPAIVPALVLGAVYAWRPGRALLWATAIMVALPSFLFFQVGALTDPGNARFFANHAALLLAGVLAGGAAARDLFARSG